MFAFNFNWRHYIMVPGELRAVDGGLGARHGIAVQVVNIKILVESAHGFST
jgi:hypothetical protein